MTDPNEPLPARANETLAWIAGQGVVLQSAKGPVPNVAQFIAGEPIRGSWWGHAAGREIYAILNIVDDSPDIVSTRLINGRVTLLHARIWPSVVRVSDHLDTSRLASIHSEHTPSGTHRSFEVDFPAWVPPATFAAAAALSLDEAFAHLPECLRAP
jgi:hypothetical protein